MRRKLFPFVCLLVGIYVGIGLMLRGAADHQQRVTETEDQLRLTLSMQETPMFTAATQNNTAEMDRLLKAGADPNETDRGLRTPLLTAAREGNLKVVQQLIAAGSKIDAQDRTGTSALLYAIKTDRNPSVTAYLLTQERMPHIRIMPGRILLMACDTADTDLMEALLLHGADVNAPDRIGLTPLMRVARGVLRERYKRSGTVEPGVLRQSAMELLLRHGADIHKRDLQGWNALLYASESEPSEGVKILLQHGADPNIEVKGRTPLRNAAYRGLVGNLQVLLDAGAKGGPTIFSDALMQASLTGHDAAAQFLLTHGADANYTDQYGMTPLMLALANDHLSTGKVLVKHGASPRTRDLLGKTAMDYIQPGRGGAVRMEVFDDLHIRRF